VFDNLGLAKSFSSQLLVHGDRIMTPYTFTPRSVLRRDFRPEIAQKSGFRLAYPLATALNPES